MNDIALKIDGVSKKYNLYDTPLDRLKESLHPFRKQYHKDFYALQGVNFEVKKGETVGIIGKNGCGKSTLLKIITGVLTPTSGSVFTNGRILALLELGTGFNHELTGIENVFFYGAIMGLPKEEIDERLDAILAFADIGDFVHQPVKTYSSGMLVRLAFAVVANMDADILVIDEALSVGDSFFVQKCMRFLRKFMEQGTILFVSHDTGAVVNLCNRAILLQNGNVKLIGSPKEVSEAYHEAIYEEQQGESVEIVNDDSPEFDFDETDYKDMRLDFINTTNLRNDVELLKFNPAAPSFGRGGASIESVILTNKNDKPLSWVVGGEMVKLKIYCKINDDIYSPIVGFQLKDQLGQQVFGDVTCLGDHDSPLCVTRGQRVVATFEFRFPIMQSGHYSISPAIAEGTLSEHVQHIWLHDALMLQVHASSVCFGLIGMPMRRISLRVIN